MGRKSTIEIVDEELWAWAQYRAKVLKMKTSEYLFKLVEKDREGKVSWEKQQ